MAYLVSSTPIMNMWMDTSFLFDQPPYTTKAFIPVEVFSVVSIPRRCLMFHVMTEMGSQHARVPIQYLWDKQPTAETPVYPLDWLQLWDSFSPYHAVVRLDYLKHAACRVVMKNRTEVCGAYQFTIDWCEGTEYPFGYSERASGHKCAHVITLENGQLAAQPNNRVIWSDGGAWIGVPLQGHHTWKVFSQEFSCEAMGWKWYTGSEELVYYPFVQRD
jgi:hypothetical protein